MELDYDAEVHTGQGPENEDHFTKWARPPPPNIHPDADSLTFQQIDIDHYIGQAMIGMPGPQVIFI